MKANTTLDFIRSRTRAGVLGIFVSAAAFPVFAADPPKTVSPDSKPVQDESSKAGKDSRPVKDSSPASGKDSRPVRDADQQANERAQDTPLDTTPVDDSSGKANQKSTRVEDGSKAAGKDSYKVDDSNMNKASGDARRTSDSSQKAGPDATELEDANRDKANPASRITSSLARARQAGPPPAVPDEPTAFESETAVREAMTEAEAAVRLSKLQITRPEEANRIIEGILSAGGAVSVAEQARGKALADAAMKAAAEVPEGMQTEVTAYLRDRLRGQLATDQKAPEFFRADDGSPTLIPITDTQRFYHEGWRYVYFHSKTSIPAILLANASLGTVKLQTAAQAARTFAPGEDQLAVLPEAYRVADSWVISYPVSKKSMISSGDIVFRRGSTQIADSYGYESVQLMAEAMKDSSLADEKFVVECHTSADGSFEENQMLSQQRAEAVAREMVRNGVSPGQLIPVGYGKAEALHPADAPEEMKSQDRRVIVFRLGDPGAAP